MAASKNTTTNKSSQPRDVSALKAEIKQLKTALKASEKECAKLNEKLIQRAKDAATARYIWFGFHQELMEKLNLVDQGFGQFELTKAMTTIDLETGRIKTPVLEQIKTLPPFGPMLRAALEIEATSEFVRQSAIEPPKKFGSYASWISNILHNLACRTLNTICATL